MGVGDQWVKLGDWELRDHILNLILIEWAKVCSSLRMRLQFLWMLQLWDFLIASLQVGTECKKRLQIYLH